MSALNGAAFVQFPLGGQVGSVRGFWRFKPSKVDAPASALDFRAELLVCRRYAKQAAGFVADACAALILSVKRVVCLSQIDKPIVGAVSVDVVNHQHWVFAQSVKPRQPVRKMQNAVDAYLHVSGAVRRARDFAGACAAFAAAPSKDAGERIVVQEFAQTLRGKIGLSHVAVPSRCGQRPHRVGSTLRPRHFSALCMFHGGAQWQ